MQLSEVECRFFDEQGYIQLEGLVDGEELLQLQEEFTRVEEATREDWRRQLVEGIDRDGYGIGETAHVVMPVAPHSDIFIDLLEHPATMPVLEAFMGPDVRMKDNALHVKPAGTRSHSEWHRDGEKIDGNRSTVWPYHRADQWSADDRRAWEQMRACETPYMKIKIFFFVYDVDAETAPFSVVPGSHKIEGPTPQYDPLEDMPNHVKLVGKAGDAILWSGSIWHTAMDNTDTKARRILLYNYTHFGMFRKPEHIPSDEFAEQIRMRSPLCRQLFGLERMARG